MKTTTKISAFLLAGSLTAALQAHATPTTFTETVNIPGGVEVFNNPYTGSFTEAGLSSGWSDSDTVSSAVVKVTMDDAQGFQVILTIDNIGQTVTYNSSPETNPYTLTSGQDSYITGVFDANGSFSFRVDADCYLESAQLILTTTTGSGNQSAPDASSTVILLGGALSALGLLKLKLA
jgi:hypothetical protein